MNDIEPIVKKFEKRTKNLTRGLIVLGVLWMVTASISGILLFLKKENSSVQDVLRVRGLVVVDKNGTERVWIGAPVPNPPILGWRHPRGDMSGIILFDEEGNERSGYVTSDGYANVMLTLDSIAQQNALFIAEPAGSTSLQIWGQDRKNEFKLNVNDSGPRLDLTHRGKNIFSISERNTDKE